MYILFACMKLILSCKTYIYVIIVIGLLRPIWIFYVFFHIAMTVGIKMIIILRHNTLFKIIHAYVFHSLIILNSLDIMSMLWNYFGRENNKWKNWGKMSTLKIIRGKMSCFINNGLEGEFLGRANVRLPFYRPSSDRKICRLQYLFSNGLRKLRSDSNRTCVNTFIEKQYYIK